MSFAVFFGCPDCSAVYQAMQHLVHAPVPGVFTCRNCGAVVQSWREQHVFTDWRLFEPETGRVAGRQQHQRNDADASDVGGTNRLECENSRRETRRWRSSDGE
jgi:transcription elongation factor Elf1